MIRFHERDRMTRRLFCWKVSGTLALVALLTSPGVSAAYACVQTPDSEIISPVEFLQMFSDQPACRVYYRAAASLPRFGLKVSFRIRIARTQGKVRREIYPLENETRLKSPADRNYKIVIIERLGQPSIALNPQQSTYTELPRDFSAVPFDLDTFLKGWMKEMNKTRFVKAGVVSIDGHQATRVKVVTEGETGDYFVYFANDLKNLLLRIGGSNPNDQTKAWLRASDISFDVPDHLFEIPSSYRKVDFSSLMSTLKGKGLK